MGDMALDLGLVKIFACPCGPCRAYRRGLALLEEHFGELEDVTSLCEVEPTIERHPAKAS
jgi:hypothetical protein